jgi:hypothetical protein
LIISLEISPSWRRPAAKLLLAAFYLLPGCAQLTARPMTTVVIRRIDWRPRQGEVSRITARPPRVAGVSQARTRTQGDPKMGRLKQPTSDDP